MDRATRDKFASGTDQSDLTAGNACWQTPPAIFADLNDRYSFDIDLCADHERALCDVWFGPGSEFAEDALTAWWSEWGSVGFCNPPYGVFIGKVLARADVEAKLGFWSVILLPLRMNKAMRGAIFESKSVVEWLICDKRIAFWENGAPRWNAKALAKGLHVPDTALFDSTILVFGPGHHEYPRVAEYRVPPHVEVL